MTYTVGRMCCETFHRLHSSNHRQANVSARLSMADPIDLRNRAVKLGYPMVRRRSKAERKTVLTCKQETDFIARYLAAELHGAALEAFEHHLELCPDCVAFLKTYKATIELTREFLAGARVREV